MARVFFKEGEIDYLILFYANTSAAKKNISYA